jgi:hypothetical protein
MRLPVTAARSASRGVCPAQNGAALLPTPPSSVRGKGSPIGQVIIGVDPHKRSTTIEVIDQRERIRGKSRFGTDRDSYQATPATSREHTDRIWAVDGCSGIGRHVPQRLVAAGETLLNVPAKLVRQEN